MLRNSFNKLRMRLATIAPRIFGGDSSILQKASAAAFVKSNKVAALTKEQEKCQKCQEIIDRCFSPSTPHNIKESISHVLSADIPRDPDKAKEHIIAQIFSDDLTKKSGHVANIIQQAVSAKEHEEKLVTKLETIKEAKVIDEVSSIKESANSNVYGERLSTYSLCDSVSDEFDEISKRCLKAKKEKYDKSLLREVERIGVPPVSSEYKHSAYYERYDNPIDAIIDDAPEKKSQDFGRPFETLLVRDPTIFNEDKEKPTFKLNSTPPMHLFQEPLVHTQAAPAMETLQLKHHTAVILEPLQKPAMVESEIEESFFDDEPAMEYEPEIQKEQPSSKTSSKFIDLATFSEATKFKDSVKDQEVTQDLEANTLHYSAQPKPNVSEPLPVDKTTATQAEPALEEPDPLPLNDKNLTLKQLLERIREKNRMEYCQSQNASPFKVKSSPANPESAYPGSCPPCPCTPPPPFCPGGKPQCLPPCNQPAPFCPGPNSKPQCIPPCQMPAGPCPQKKTCIKSEKPNFKPFFKDLVMMLIQIGVIETTKPKRISRIFSSFLFNCDVCAFAILSSDFMPLKLDDPEKVKGLLKARDYEPWSPIPSWPIPKTEKKQPLVCPQEGCKLIPPPRLNPPCLENPCKNLPLPRTYHIPYSYTPLFAVGGV